MPTKKNRDSGHDKNMKPFSLRNAMGIPGGSYDAPHRSNETVSQNIRNGASGKQTAQHKGGGLNTKAGYDVKTRINLPSGKAAGSAARTQRKMKST